MDVTADSNDGPRVEGPMAEVEAMHAIATALQGLDADSCARVLDWAADYYAGCLLMHRTKPAPVLRARTPNHGGDR